MESFIREIDSTPFPLYIYNKMQIWKETLIRIIWLNCATFTLAIWKSWMSLVNPFIILSPHQILLRTWNEFVLFPFLVLIPLLPFPEQHLRIKSNRFPVSDTLKDPVAVQISPRIWWWNWKKNPRYCCDKWKTLQRCFHSRVPYSPSLLAAEQLKWRVVVVVPVWIDSRWIDGWRMRHHRHSCLIIPC